MCDKLANENMREPYSWDVMCISRALIWAEIPQDCRACETQRFYRIRIYLTRPEYNERMNFLKSKSLVKWLNLNNLKMSLICYLGKYTLMFDTELKVLTHLNEPW